MRRAAKPGQVHGAKPTRSATLALICSIAAGAMSKADAQPPPVSPDDFVAAAAGSNQYEIMAGRLALIESHDPAVRAFATRMIQEHTAAFAALRQAAIRSGLKPPSTNVGGDQTMLLAALQGVRDGDFDQAYIRQQRLAHVQALTTEQGYARDGSDANLRKAAQTDVPMIERHLQSARDFR